MMGGTRISIHSERGRSLARGTNLKWLQAQGGWASAKVLLDWYGHFLPTESKGYADALSDSPGRPYTAPPQRPAMRQRRAVAKTRRTSRGTLAPRGGIEPPTCCLEDPEEPEE